MSLDAIVRVTSSDAKESTRTKQPLFALPARCELSLEACTDVFDQPEGTLTFEDCRGESFLWDHHLLGEWREPSG